MEVLTNAMASFQAILESGSKFPWVGQVFLIVLATLLAAYLMKKLFDRLALKAKNSNTAFDDLLIDTARKPVGVFIWFEGILLAAEVVRRVSDEPVFSLIDPIREVSFITIFAWFAVRLIRQAEDLVQQPGVLKKEMDATTASALGKLFRLSVIITTALVILQTLGFSISGILAFGGIGGIAIGFAAKDLLSNFFGGLMIYMDQPFRVGDWVRSPDKDIEGTVEDIGWRLTCIRTFDKRPLYVPNATFASISVENPSRMSNRRIKETVGVRYDDADKVAAIVADVKQMLLDHPEIDTEQTLIVNVNAFASSSIDFFIYTFTKTTEWIRFHEIKQDVMLKVIDIVQRNGAEFAFPTQTLHLLNEEPEPAGMK